MSITKPQYEPNEIYHIYNRGNGWEKIFMDEENYFFFLTQFAKRLTPLLKVYAYCLLPNHFHFLVRVRSKSELMEFQKLKLRKAILCTKDLEEYDINKIISRGLTNFLISYSKAFNKRYNRRGSLLMPNTKRKLVGSDKYFATLVRYIHFNPVFHNIVIRPEDWAHSSLHAYLSKKPTKLAREEVLQWFGGLEQFKLFHEDFSLEEMHELKEMD